MEGAGLGSGVGQAQVPAWKAGSACESLLYRLTVAASRETWAAASTFASGLNSYGKLGYT